MVTVIAGLTFAGGFIAAVVLSGALRGPSTPPAQPAVGDAGASCIGDSLVGTVSVASVTARAQPSPTAKAVDTFQAMAPYGVPQVFALEDRAVGPNGGVWYKALLPVKPNGSSAYIPQSAVHLSTSPYRLVVNLDDRQMALYRHCDRGAVYPVAVGKPTTPTPRGHFYLTGLFKPDPNSVYGSYAYSLSAHSEVLTWWKFGGIVGLHGTNDPSSIGKNVTHGCIRLRNADITKLARMLPIGTPITVE